MARVYGIKKRLEQNDVPEEVVKEIMGSDDLRDIIVKMEKTLEHELMYRILDSCACGISQKELKSIKEIKADSLDSKIRRIAELDDFHSEWGIRLNDDTTLVGGWALKTVDGSFACACSAAADKGMKVSELVHSDRIMPLAYCFCCAGHCRRHLEALLGIQLKTSSIISTPINSKGKDPCSFEFKIVTT